MAEKSLLETGGLCPKLQNDSVQRPEEYARRCAKPLHVTYSFTEAKDSDITRRLDAAFHILFEAISNRQFDT
jgi:hypothetical protein